ncbi:ATP-binding protein, partial [Campylobacter jejuni]
CTNCIEHAYRGHRVGTMLVDVRAVDGAVHARVVDSGSWKTPAPEPSNGGRGLMLINAIGDAVEIDNSPGGTAIEVTFRLSG